MKKLFTREVKISLMVIAALAVLYFGLNYLKGINIFKPTNHYFLVYSSVDGLQQSNPVYIKGYQIGQVSEIKYDFSKPSPFVVQISIKKDIKIPQGTRAELCSDGLMGGMAIDLILSQSETLHTVGDTLPAVSVPDMITQLSETILPRVGKSLDQIDSFVNAGRDLLASDHLKNSLASIDKITSDLRQSSSQLNRLMNSEVPRIMMDVDTISTDLKSVSSELKQVNYANLFKKIEQTVADLEKVVAEVNNGEGTLGLLLNDTTLYRDLNQTVNSANSLLLDLRENPKRYVHFSVFGKSSK